MSIENIKLVIDLIKCKTDILKLKADSYNWNCHVDDNTRSQLEDLLISIDDQLKKLSEKKEKKDEH